MAKRILFRDGKIVFRNSAIVFVEDGTAGDCECCGGDKCWYRYFATYDCAAETPAWSVELGAGFGDTLCQADAPGDTEAWQFVEEVGSVVTYELWVEGGNCTSPGDCTPGDPPAEPTFDPCAPCSCPSGLAEQYRVVDGPITTLTRDTDCATYTPGACGSEPAWDQIFKLDANCQWRTTDYLNGNTSTYQCWDGVRVLTGSPATQVFLQAGSPCHWRLWISVRNDTDTGAPSTRYRKYGGGSPVGVYHAECPAAVPQMFELVEVV